MPKQFTKRIGYGLTPPLMNLDKPEAIVANKAPGLSDRYDVGQIWIHEDAHTAYILTTYLAGQPVWVQIDNTSITGVEWTVTAANAIQATNNHGYIVTGNPPIITLPVASLVGNVIKIIGSGDHLWEIHCNAGQRIRFAGQLSAIAGAPALVATGEWNTVTLITHTANTIFEVVDTNGNLNLRI